MAYKHSDVIIFIFMVVITIAVAQTNINNGNGNNNNNNPNLNTANNQIEYAEPRKQGANVCAYLTRPGIINYKIYTYCLPWKQEFCSGYTTFIYDCCPGFIRTQAFSNKCVEGAKSWKMIPDYLITITGHRQFANALRSGGFLEISNEYSLHTFTVFVPYQDKDVAQLFSGYAKDENHPVRASLVHGRVYVQSLRNGMTIPTLMRNYSLKVTRYSNGVICVECQMFVEPDHEARNGIVHFMSGAIDVKERRSLYEVLQSREDTKLFAEDIPIKLKRLLLQSDIPKWYTIFAPSNKLWTEIRSKYPNLLDKIASNHVLSGMYCKAALVREISKLGPTEAGEYLSVACNDQGVRIIRSYCNYETKINIDNKEIMTSNGLIYIISDQVLIPKFALDFQTLIENPSCFEGNSAWIQYLKECDLRMNSNKKYAVLIPTQKAFTWWKNTAAFSHYLQRFNDDKLFACRLIRYHIMEMVDINMSKLAYLWQQQSGYRTNNVDEQYQVDYFLKRVYGSELNFNYSPVDKFESIPFKDGSIYRINRVNMIPENTVMQIIENRTDLTNFLEVAAKSNFDSAIIKKYKPRNLILAVKNGAWKQDLLKKDGDEILSLMKLHWVNLYLWNKDIGYFDKESRHRFMSGSGLELIFDRQVDGTIFIGTDNLPSDKWIKVLESNLYGTNGMVWIVDSWLDCPITHCKPFYKEQEIWKVLVFSCWDVYEANRSYTAKEIIKSLEKWLAIMEKDGQCYSHVSPRSTTKKVEGYIFV